MNAFYQWVEDYWEKHLLATKPDSASIIQKAALFNLEWSNIGNDTLKIEYSTDNGQTWNLVADNVPAQPEIFTWQVPDLIASFCYIRLTSTSNRFITDDSDVFKIGNTTSLNEVLHSSFSFYPNPVNDYLIFNSGDQPFSGEILVTDMGGELVRKVSVTDSDKTKINFSDLSGMFIIHVASQTQQSSFKVIAH
jgi:hypothetical protein